MALNPQSDDLYKRIAATLVQNRQTPTQAAFGAPQPSRFFGPGTPAPEPVKAPEQWSLGQGIIDVLSSGSYLTAGMGRKIGENVAAIQAGQTAAFADAFNPLSLIQGGIQGIADRRTWSENLADWGVEEGKDTGVLGIKQRDMQGLGLDILLDPLWLIPGGAIAASIKGTAKGVALSSGASKAGVKLSDNAVKSAQKATEDFQRPLLTDNLEVGKEGIKVNPVVQEFFPQTGQKIPLLSKEGVTNLVQGVRYATADEYAKWGAQRAKDRAAKAARKRGDDGAAEAVGENPFDQGPGGILAALTKPIDEINTSKTPGEAAVRQVEEVVDNADGARTVPDSAKDIEAQPKTVQEAIPSQTIRQTARETLAPAKSKYIASKNLDDLKVDFDSVQVSPLAGSMADVYNRAVSDPTNPEVVAAYRALVDETREQLRVMEEDLGIRIEYVDTDPYNVIGKDGLPVPSSKLMMEDVVNNKRLQVRDSSDDFAANPHPIFTVDENNMFRAVHDFFGHAGSGRGFDAAGEEAAWLSHSQMFTPLARRAMTTETRGQNSYYNKFGEFAPQKAFLFPEEFVLAPTQYSAIERRVEATNQFIGMKSNALVEFSDILLPDLAMVSAPIKGSKLYSPEEIKQLRAKYNELTSPGKYAPTTKEAKRTTALLSSLTKFLSLPSKFTTAAKAMPGEEPKSITDLLSLAQDALRVDDPEIQEAGQRALAILRQTLDEPVDATSLLESALRAENRVVNDPQPFRPTIWSAPVKEGQVSKPLFSEDKLRTFFPDDELLLDNEALDIAMGRVKSTKTAAARQQVIWEQFRARNHDVLAEVVEREKNAWFEANSIANSEFFTKSANGTVIGQGLLPTSIPRGTIYTLNGRPTTTIALLLDNMGSVINRTGPQMGGLPTTRIEATIAGRVEALPGQIAGSPVVREGGQVVVPEIAKVRAALKKRGRGIELDSYPVVLQKWLLDEIDNIAAKIGKEGVTDFRILDEAINVDTLATRLWDDIPFLKSRTDARKIATLGPEAFAQLAKLPQRQYFIDAPFSRQIGMPDPYGIARQASVTGARGEKRIVARDPESGVPIDSTGKPVPEAQAEILGRDPFVDGDGIQYRVLAEGGKAYTGRLVGRSGSPAAPQTGAGPQQLAGLQAIRSTVGAINEAITAKTLPVSKEQSDFLANVLNTLEIRVAPDATPGKIFQQFKNEALPRFEEIVARIESAAKIESVAYHAKAIFKTVDKENISLMKAIEDYDIAEIQLQSLKFTDDAMQLVDDTCRATTRGVAPSGGPVGGNLLMQVLGGLS